jgi:hypothetical protein
MSAYQLEHDIFRIRNSINYKLVHFSGDSHFLEIYKAVGGVDEICANCGNPVTFLVVDVDHLKNKSLSFTCDEHMPPGLCQLKESNGF